MKQLLKKLPFAFTFALLFTTAPHQAAATLGEPADSVAKDRDALHAVHKATVTAQCYTMQEVASDAASVREYIDASGIVFAVAWNGRIHPDLTQILGSYAEEFEAAKKRQSHRHGQKRLRVKGDSVVVETWGHMRNLQGRAYLPALLPEGVSVDEIR